MNPCREKSELVKMGQKNIGHLHEDPSVFHVGSNICSLKINRMHCYVSIAVLSIFVILLTAKCMSS